MKKYFSILAFALFSLTVFAQSELKNISNENNANYYLANIYQNQYSGFGMYHDSFFISCYTFHDSKNQQIITKENDEVFSGVLISVVPDGDYYTESKLYKITGLINPSILLLKESTFPDVILVIEEGNANKRRKLEYLIKGY